MLSVDGRLFGFGRSDFGQLAECGIDRDGIRVKKVMRPTRIEIPKTECDNCGGIEHAIQQVQCGSEHTMIITGKLIA